jgi:hypothetical protein
VSRCSAGAQGLPASAPDLQRLVTDVALQADDGVDAGLVHQAILRGVPGCVEAKVCSLSMPLLEHHHALDVVMQ